MAQTSAFKKDALQFLRTHAVRIHGNVGSDLTGWDTGSQKSNYTSKHQFSLRQVPYLENLQVDDASLAGETLVTGSKVTDLRGYFVPWKADMTHGMPLGSDANFCFTAPMSGCCFIVMGLDQQNPLVFHANWSEKDVPLEEAARQEYVREQDTFYRELALDLRDRYYGQADRAKVVLTCFLPTHYQWDANFSTYAGGTVRQSASVYGLRDVDTGNWKFFYHFFLNTNKDKHKAGSSPAYLRLVPEVKDSSNKVKFLSITGVLWPGFAGPFARVK